MKEELINEFYEWINFISSIENLNWSAPLGEGKWRIHDVVSHIYLWDKYFLEEAIHPITTECPLTLKHQDFDEFNNKAVEIGKGQTKQEIINFSLYYRNAIINEIKGQEDSKFNKEYKDGDGNGFIIETYLRDFIWHDRHHMKQIEDRRALL